MSFSNPESPEGATTVAFTSDVLDEHTIQGGGEHLLRLAKESGWADLHLDLSSVEFVTAGGVGCLISLRNHLRDAGVALTLNNVKSRVYMVFKLTRLNKLLDVRLKNAVPPALQRKKW